LAALHPRRRRSDLRAAIPFLLPGFLGLATFLILPLFASLLLSFSNWQVIGQTRFVGLANYVNLFTRDPIFWGVFRTTLLYTVEYLALNLVISLAMAVWIGSLSWGQQLFRLVFFLPTFTPLIGISLVWLLMLTPGGIVDGVFATLGAPVPNLITSPA
jgi:multiple sugar transport system permease protein